MRITKLLLLAAAFFAFSCSDDDEPAPLEKRGISLAENDQVITVPQALLSSTDPYANMAAGWIMQANAMSAYLHFFDMPTGAQKSEAKITASNGRVKDAGDHVTYVWSDTESGYSVAFQVSEETDRYVFEIFLKIEAGAEFLKYFHAEEKKDRSEGFMKIYDIFGIYGDDASVVWINYEWTRAGNIFNLSITEHSDSFELDITIDLATNAGSVTSRMSGVKQYVLTWDGAGNGTWAQYNDEGTVIDSGAWTA
ncbi:MAG TPA: hypothetical protein VKZ86_03565 [Cyclobacteriaceae bacterium]|nr:hypothetical protein [Cyclobacteriaceae bacterium]